MICAQASRAQLNVNHIPAKAQALPQITKLCLISWHMCSISPRQSACPIGMANMACSICHYKTHDMAKILWSTWKWLNYALLLLLTLNCVDGLWFAVHLEFAADESLEALCCIILRIQLMQCIMRLASQELVMLPNNSLRLILVTNNNLERQWNPTLAISEIRHNNSNIKTFDSLQSNRGNGFICAVKCALQTTFLTIWIS